MNIIEADEAAALVRDGDSLLIGGSGGGHAVPERLIVALQERYLATEEPRKVTVTHVVGIGDEGEMGMNRLAHAGLIKRSVTSVYTDSPKLGELARADAIESYLLPQGALSQLMREMAAGRPGLITHVGLHTFVDPRQGGGRMSPSTREPMVDVVQIDGRDLLRYRPFPIDIAFLRGTTADEDGNITMEQEAVFGEMLSMAQATRRAGGIVVVQVRRLAARRSLPPKSVKIPGILVDFVVVDAEPWQTYETRYSAAYAGEFRVPMHEIHAMPLNVRKIIARRAALELFPGAICNLGAGVSTGIASVAAEEDVLDLVTLTNEQGLIGGAPAGGNDAGASTNYAAMVDQPYQFDFYDGGGLELAFLSFAQVGLDGSVNVSKFGDRIIGCGGFINISQNAQSVVFSGTFRAGDLQVEADDGRLVIIHEGRHAKFLPAVEHVTYNGPFAAERGQPALYVTERAVFRRGPEGLEIIEVAPGIDVEEHILARMDAPVRIAPDLRLMDARIFRPEPMGLATELPDKPVPTRRRTRERPHPEVTA
jgi:propionate CoA-transferase